MQFASPSFSQDGDDMILREFLHQKLAFKQPGVYVDVGAFHPMKYSNTHFFYLSGWRGFNIEPNPDAEPLFKEHRPNDIFINCGVSPQASTLTYFMFDEPAYNTFNEKEARERFTNQNISVKRELTIQCKPLAEILEQYMQPEYLQMFELMSIDAEGMDMEVLSSNDWARFRPHYVIAECRCEYIEDISNDEAVKYMAQYDYRPVAKTMRNIIFRTGPR